MVSIFEGFNSSRRHLAIVPLLSQEVMIMYNDTLLDRIEEEAPNFFEDTRKHIALILEDNSIEVVFENEDELQYYLSVGGVKIRDHVVLDEMHVFNVGIAIIMSDGSNEHWFDSVIAVDEESAITTAYITVAKRFIKDHITNSFAIEWVAMV